MTTMTEMLASIPYLVPHALTLLPSEEDTVVVQQPFRREVTNIIGTLHAGALFTLAETAAGLAAFQAIPGGRPMVLLRSATVRYTRRAERDLVARGRVAADQAAPARAAFAADGRADVAIDVTIVDPDETVMFEGTFDYALRTPKA